MPFTTVDFVIFFAIVFVGYYVLPHRSRWLMLLIGSWVFYGWLSLYYLFFLGFTTIVTYCVAVWVDGSHRAEKIWIGEYGKSVSREEKKMYKVKAERQRWRISCLAVVVLVGMLVVFKYLEFLVVNVSWCVGALGFNWRSPSLNLILPIGLSFYVFQSMAYMIDVQRGEIAAERNFCKHALYVSYFPQIMQGPIGNYGRLACQLFERHDFNYEQAVFGIQRIAWGFFKKVMIANIIANRIDHVWIDASNYSGLVFWSGVLFLYAVQLYADFSGYMDIACGCSQMLGIKLDENFCCPYFSKSVSEYWRRWHMSLSSWFKDYLFYPVLRSDWNTKIRKWFEDKYLAASISTAIALAIVWTATGLWHGASWGYVAWGVYYGFFMILGVFLQPVYERWHKLCPRLIESRLYVFFQISRTFLIVLCGYAIFKPADLEITAEIVRQGLSGIGLDGVSRLMHMLHVNFWRVLLAMALMFVVDVVHYSHPKGTIRSAVRRLPCAVRWAFYVLGLWLMAFYGLYGVEYQQFEYFKF